MQRQERAAADLDRVGVFNYSREEGTTAALLPHRIAQLGLGYCPEERGIFASLTCEENLLLPPQVASGGMSLDEIYAMFPNLRERRASQSRADC